MTSNNVILFVYFFINWLFIKSQISYNLYAFNTEMMLYSSFQWKAILATLYGQNAHLQYRQINGQIAHLEELMPFKTWSAFSDERTKTN